MTQAESRCTRVDAVRERELFRYFEPPEVELPVTGEDGIIHEDAAKPSTPPNITLTALAQLCALRLDASRAVISVIAKETMYFLAEATKFTDITEDRAREVENDDMWFGRGTTNKTGGLCEYTLILPTCPGTYPHFTVPDMTQDERFSQLPFVTGAPHFRFYAGTPLTTSNGVNIGSFFIFDDKVRPGLTAAEEKYFGSCAATIMSHLEVAREAEERAKVLRMSRGLNAFVEGKNSLNADDHQAGTIPTNPTDGAADDVESTHTSIEGAHKATFSRAANLLTDSLNLRTRGGVCFLDTLTGPRSLAMRGTGTKALDTESDSEPRELAGNTAAQKKRNTGVTENTKVAEVISFSGSSPIPLNSPERRRPSTFSALEERFVQSLLKHYPRGKVWIFDAAEGLTSEEDDRILSGSRASEEQRERRLLRKKLERETLQCYFPGDFSKINTFERNWRDARKSKNDRRPSKNEVAKRAVVKDAPPLMSIYAVTDVAAIVEEVVEGVYAGQIYRDYGSADMADVSAGQRGKTADRGLSGASKSLLGGNSEPPKSKTIEVILDIAHEDYCFIAQPGALRRVRNSIDPIQPNEAEDP
ncbi:MAG: hypothetical protein Q9218_006831 [Villophora microphyllina]